MACSQPATGAQTQHFITEEAICGVTPTSPVWDEIRYTSGNLSATKDTLLSAELDGSREISNITFGNKQTSGEISVELSVTSHDNLLEAALGGTWSLPGSGSLPVVTVDAATKTVTSTGFDFTQDISVGDLVRFLSLTLGKNSFAYRVTAVSTNVVTFGTAPKGFLVDEPSTPSNFVTSSEVSVGVTRRTFSILTHYIDADDGVGEYHISKGMEISGFSFNISVNAIVTGTFSMIGRTYSADIALPTGSTFNPTPTSLPYSHLHGVVVEGGVSLGLVTSMTMTNDNAASGLSELGNDAVSFIERGRSNNTLSISTFFKDSILLNKFLSETAVQVIMTLTNSSGALSFEFGNVKYTSAGPEVGGESSITQTLAAQATGNSTTPSLIIKRLAI